MTTTERAIGAVHVGSLEALRRDQPKVVSAGGRTVVLFLSEDQVFALDNRCPHMGFPLSRGTVRDGILTCHWHHARFDLAGGCTFDPFADDVPRFRVEVRDGEVWLDPAPVESDRRGHWLRKLQEGLEQNIRLVLAKSVIGLHEAGETAIAGPGCLLCYEADWQRCHRRRVAEILAARHGFHITHLAVDAVP